MKKTFNHLKKIFIHKWWVFYYCCKLRIPWQGIMHDISKFSWTELKESIKYYQGDKSPIPIAKKENGYSEAWQHHKGRNKHHFEYWIDFTDKDIKIIPMPYKYVLELIADYLGAFRAYNGYMNFEEEYQWWLKKSEQIEFMNPATKSFITQIFRYIHYNNDNINYVNNDNYWKNVYYELLKNN